MPSGRDIVTRALRHLNQLQSSEVPTGAELVDGLVSLNQMLGSWSLDPSTLIARPRIVVPLVASQVSYTIGPSGNVDVARPNQIRYASIIVDRTATDPVESTIESPLTVPEWQRISLKSLTAPFPAAIYYDRTVSALGQSTIWVYPIPTSSLSDLVLYCESPFSAFDASTDVVMADGYARALETNLALDLAAGYGAAPSGDLRDMAADSLYKLQVANHRQPTMRLSGALPGMASPGQYDVYAGR